MEPRLHVARVNTRFQALQHAIFVRVATFAHLLNTTNVLQGLFKKVKNVSLFLLENTAQIKLTKVLALLDSI